MNSFAVYAYIHRICPSEFFIVFELKKKQQQQQISVGNYAMGILLYAANESTLCKCI